MPFCHSYYAIIWPMLAWHLLGLLYAFPLLNSSGPVLSSGSIHAILGFLGLFHCFQASLAHFLSLGILGPFQFFILIGLCWVFWAFPTQITISFTFGVYGFSHQNLTHLIHYFRPLWPILACFLFLIMPMGLLLFSLSSFRPACFLWGTFAIF